MKALIFAAGKGTRLKPFTDYHPKALAKVNGVSLLERNIKYLQSYGINDFVINIHHFGDQIIDFLIANNNFGSNIEISDERNELLETGGGLVFAKPFLENEEFFLVMNADILTDIKIDELIDYHKSNKDLVTLAVSDRSSTRKLLFDKDQVLNGWINLQTGEKILSKYHQDNLKQLAFSGVHCINRLFFSYIKRIGKFSIMQEYLDLMDSISISAYIHNANLVDVGKPEAIKEAEKIFI